MGKKMTDKVETRSEQLSETLGGSEIPVENTNSAASAWELGDLAWARVGRHPFWPCVVVMDPKNGQYMYSKKLGRSDQQQLHVQFFGDKGSHSWVSSNWTLKFAGTDDLLKFAETKKKDKKYSSAFPQPKANAKWKLAVQEAEEAANKSRKARVEFFEEYYPIGGSIESDAGSRKTVKEDAHKVSRAQKRSAPENQLLEKKEDAQKEKRTHVEKSDTNTPVEAPRKKIKRRKLPKRPAGNFEVYHDQCAHIVSFSSPELDGDDDKIRRMMLAMWSLMSEEEKSKYYEGDKKYVGM